MNTLLAPFLEWEEYIQMKVALERGDTPISAVGCTDAQKCHFIFGTYAEKDAVPPGAEAADARGLEAGGNGAPFRLIVTHNEMRAKDIVEDYRMYDKNVLYYPAKDLIFYSADIHGRAIAIDRLKVIRAIAERKPVTIVTTIDAGMDHCLSFELFDRSRVTLSVGDVVNLTELAGKLSEMGYENVAQVGREGEFSVRGGIIDIFPLTEETPCRIELWDDEVDTIRNIDVESQRSVENLEQTVIYPAAEIFMPEDRKLRGLKKIRGDMEKRTAEMLEKGMKAEAHRLRQNIEEFQETFEAYHGMLNLESYIRYFVPDKEIVSFFDYFMDRNVLVFMDEPNRCAEKAEAVEYEFRESMAGRLEKGYILPGQADVLFALPKVWEKLQKYPLVLLSALDVPVKGLRVERKFFFDVKSSPSYNNNFSLLVKDIARLKKQKYRVVLVSGSETRGRRLCDDLLDYDINAFYDGKLLHELLPGEVMVTRGNIRRGFEYPELRFVVVTESDIFGGIKRKGKKKIKRRSGAAVRSFNDLKIGDYVVHENHGLGIYKGIEKIEVERVTRDYFKIEYAGGSNLYVPVTALEMLQKYAGGEAKPPKLNRLNTPEWKKTKSRVKKAVEEIAQELVELYAKRSGRQGYAYDRDTVWQREFEELFPYEETEDQLRAIEETKADMESTKIMDRLICGDVGFGKTEIAIRAAFKAVMDGKQVAVLVPTTILAGQHYNTFAQRMKDFGVNVEMLCRLRTPKEQKKTIEGIKKGSVDIAVGTHRLLGKDVAYKNLGLLIVDEEQRFGVRHKEKLKEIKNEIDVLTLSATPIPRTLHMSLVGIRDMSLLEEPPVDRVPIQTFVMEKNEEIVREAILREVGRGGQVYYVYNRVGNMDIVANEVAKLVPEAVVACAHGQMNERELERAMFRFVEGEIDVLVSTTIVETGLDIPNVNTIIIEDADRFGLSQLYQLRGRVGRSSRTAYAFLMYRRNRMLPEVAEKRLSAIREFTDLGSGFKISMRDLEIRGAGNLLGASQHGHMEAVGYDMYCKMLNEAVGRMKGEGAKRPEEQDFDTSVEIKVDAFIPVGYIKNELQKLDIYKRIAEIESEEEKNDIVDELVDRFGEPPKSVMNLLDIALLKARAHRAYITEIADKGGEIRCAMYERADIDAAGIPALISSAGNRLRFAASPEPGFFYRADGGLIAAAEEAVGWIESLCQKEGETNEK